MMCALIIIIIIIIIINATSSCVSSFIAYTAHQSYTVVCCLFLISVKWHDKPSGVFDMYAQCVLHLIF